MFPFLGRVPKTFLRNSSINRGRGWGCGYPPTLKLFLLNTPLIRSPQIRLKMAKIQCFSGEKWRLRRFFFDFRSQTGVGGWVPPTGWGFTHSVTKFLEPFLTLPTLIEAKQNVNKYIRKYKNISGMTRRGWEIFIKYKKHKNLLQIYESSTIFA